MARGSEPVDETAAAADFEAFFRSEHPRLVSVGVALLGDRELARDIVQEALLRAYNEWARVSRLDHPGAWVRRVLINLCIDVGRRRGRERLALARTEPDADVPSPDPADEQLWAAVRELPRLQRGVVALHYVDDMSVADVADVLGVSVGTVKTSLSRARSSLAPSLRPLFSGEVAT